MNRVIFESSSEGVAVQLISIIQKTVSDAIAQGGFVGSISIKPELESGTDLSFVVNQAAPPVPQAVGDAA